MGLIFLRRELPDFLLPDSTSFKFGPEQKAAFQQLKDHLAEEPVLHLYRQISKLELHTCACKLGFGAILLQEGEDEKFHSIHYWNKKISLLRKKKKKKCSYELEVLVVIETLKKLWNYPLGTKFKIYSTLIVRQLQKPYIKKELSPKVTR